MLEDANTWALVLAAGEGSRLRILTTLPSGTAIPKQFCSLFEGPSLLQEALRRAQAVADSAHTCVVVAEQHRRWWKGALDSVPAENVIVQPENRGTANGILLPLLHVLARDPGAQVVLLPSDHHVSEEAVLASALRRAAEQLSWRFDEMLLLGIEPEEADPELGYILPGMSDGQGALTVARFIEKPPAAQARELIRAGGLWNAFIIAASAEALLTLIRRRAPEVVEGMRSAVERDRDAGTAGSAVAELYRHLPILDFSRDILPGQESALRVLPLPRCGWSDLGTPKRVAAAVRAVPRPVRSSGSGTGIGQLSLAAQHSRLATG
jgi:mannose-1-phosphate guanylyltransferase